MGRKDLVAKMLREGDQFHWVVGGDSFVFVSGLSVS